MRPSTELFWTPCAATCARAQEKCHSLSQAAPKNPEQKTPWTTGASGTASSCCSLTNMKGGLRTCSTTVVSNPETLSCGVQGNLAMSKTSIASATTSSSGCGATVTDYAISFSNPTHASARLGRLVSILITAC